MKKDKKLKEQILNADDGYDLNEFLLYRNLPISKKLDFLEEMSEFFGKFTPVENKKIWEQLKEDH